MEVFVTCITRFGIYLAVCIVAVFGCRLTRDIPQPVFRKMLHFIPVTAIPFMILVSDAWWPPVVILGIRSVAAYPLLALAERWSGFDHFLVQKRPGEIKQSLIDLCVPQMVLAAVFYGWLDLPYVVAAGVLTWGVGDTFAALIGIRYGRHKVKFKYADHNKSWEGTIASCLSSLAACLIVLLLASPYSPAKCILLSLVTAPVSAFTELCTKNGNDTITVSAANCIVLTVLALLLP